MLLTGALSLPFSALATGLKWLPSELPETPFAGWSTKPGDSLVVNTDTNIGYLVHEDRGFTSFRVVTGQRRTVQYIGRTYNAKTPVRSWKVTSKEIKKGDKTTFGQDGVFLRMFYKDEKTAYGIHTHRSADEMLLEDQRFRSMGCVIVSKSVLDIIEQTLVTNGNELQVITTNGMGQKPVTYEQLANVVRLTPSSL